MEKLTLATDALVAMLSEFVVQASEIQSAWLDFTLSMTKPTRY